VVTSRWMVEQNGFGGILFHRKPMNNFVEYRIIEPERAKIN